MKNNVKTTVIGSYPAQIDTRELMDDYFTQKQSHWKKYIESSVNDMINAGIDIISDGQTRDPFVQIFTRNLKGCRIRDRTEIIDKIEYKGPITVEDQKYIRKIIPKEKQIVGLITGPFTLTKSSIDLYYKDEEKLAYDFAYALNEEAKNLQKHTDLISVDEPFFSTEMPKYAKEIIDIVFNKITCPKRLHVCGDVSNIIPDLLDMPIDILSHEFKASPQLLDAFKKYDVTKKICLGSVRSDDTVVESADEITQHIQKAKDIFNDKIVQIAPDCGQRMLPKHVAFQKLKNLVSAGEKIYD